jgi:hypothetical protein
MADIKFLRIDKQYATDRSGSPLGRSNYVYEVDRQTVSVEINSYLINDWDVGQAQVIEAVKTFIEDEINKGWSPKQSTQLNLDEHSLKPIAEKLGWKPRN